MNRILVASSNPGKLSELIAAAESSGIAVVPLPDFASLPSVLEDRLTFEANARKKAEQYSLHAAGEFVLAEDSGLEVDALNGAPGVHSARYAAEAPHLVDKNTDDSANNLRLLREMRAVPLAKRTARYVCVIAVASGGKTAQTFRGEAQGEILETPRGGNGFGYDPLFFFPAAEKTFAELTRQEKQQYSHRGAAFGKLLQWLRAENRLPFQRR